MNKELKKLVEEFALRFFEVGRKEGVLQGSRLKMAVVPRRLQARSSRALGLHVSRRTFNQFEKELKEGHYTSVVGARRGAAYLPKAKRENALALVAAHFNIAIDEPGEATRGARVGRPVVGRRQARQQQSQITEILDYAKKHGRPEAAKKFGVSPGSIAAWLSHQTRGTYKRRVTK